MKTRRSKLASEILELVKTFFKGDKFRNRPDSVKEYIHWALGSGGPAYYETPIPILCTLQPDDPDYPVRFSTIGDLCSQSTLGTGWLSMFPVHPPDSQVLHQLHGKVHPPPISGTKGPTNRPVCTDFNRSMSAPLFATDFLSDTINRSSTH